MGKMYLASADNTDLGFHDNYHAQPHPIIIVYCTFAN